MTEMLVFNMSANVCLFLCVKREKNSVLASQRRLERKLKELNMAMEEERETHIEQRDQVSHSPSAAGQALRLYPIQENASSAVAACSSSKSSEETGGRGRDGAGKDWGPEEKGTERHGRTDGAEGSLTGQSHSTRNWAQVSTSLSLNLCHI